jgi:3',5'-cyclic AMP phosphodiesterase CpdA
MIAQRLAAITALVLLMMAPDRRFTIAVIPDTQNYTDYTHQKAAGFPFDASQIFLEQMSYIAAHAQSAGGDIAFVTSMGDIWQHQTAWMDPAHEARGLARAKNAFWDPITAPAKQTREFEIPLALRGYRMLIGRVPFSVVPGNHDYDAMWTHQTRAAAPGLNPRTAGALHTGGLTNFTRAFSPRSEFFKDRAWYVAANDDGGDSAQIFDAGGYRFLHIGLQFDAPNASIAWAASVIARYPGLPTIVSTHNYLDNDGGRKTDPVADNHALDAEANTPEMVCDKLISRHDQIFLVLCGHRGHAFSVDRNRAGHEVYQVMSNYQGRRQTAIAAGLAEGDGIGDGWMRLLVFDLTSDVPSIHVRTWSTHYKRFGTEAQDDFLIPLTGFKLRFGSTPLL